MGTVLFAAGLAAGAGAGGTTRTVTTTSVRTVTPDPVTVTKTVTRTRIRVRFRPPPSSGVNVNYGEWRGSFRIMGASVQSDNFGAGNIHGSVIGQIEYLGGLTCQPGYVEVSGTFFNRRGRIIGTGLWNATSTARGARLPLDVGGDVRDTPTRADVVVSNVTCND